MIEVDPSIVGQQVNTRHLEELLGLVEQVGELLLLCDVALDKTNPQQI